MESNDLVGLSQALSHVALPSPSSNAIDVVLEYQSRSGTLEPKFVIIRGFVLPIPPLPSHEDDDVVY